MKIFNWLATMWGGKIDFKTPMLFCAGFLFQFLAAGLTGIMMSAAPFDWQLGKLHFWLFLIGFHLTFDFMHIPGLLGMPRRIYTYEPGRGWDAWNLIVSIGVFFQATAVLVFVANLVFSYFKGRTA